LLRGDEYLSAEGGLVTGISPERMLDEFKRKARPFIDFLPQNDFEWLFIMQHHGVPTRLLDWTSNALVALYFAVNGLRPTKNKSLDEDLFKNAEFCDDAAAIYLINPIKVNEALHVGISDPVDVACDFEQWGSYCRPMESKSSPISTYAPICITAPQVSPRIRAQSGLFTLHGSNIWELDYYTVLRPLITKILIPYDAAFAIQSQLHSFGITESFIFPDLDGVAREIRSEELRKYAWERRRHLIALDGNVKNAESGAMKKKVKTRTVNKPKVT
jgi:hypothetical protein